MSDPDTMMCVICHEPIEEGDRMWIRHVEEAGVPTLDEAWHGRCGDVNQTG